MHAVEIDVRADTLALAQAGRVDGDEYLAVQFETHVNTVACRSRHFTDNHPLGIHERIDESTLAHVAPPHDGRLHGGRLAIGVGRLGQSFKN